MDSSFLTAIFTKLFAPAITFLKDQGVWQYLVKIHDFLKGPAASLFGWVSDHVNIKDVIAFIVATVKFIISLFITLFHVIVNIVQWIGTIIH